MIILGGVFDPREGFAEVLLGCSGVVGGVNSFPNDLFKLFTKKVVVAQATWLRRGDHGFLQNCILYTLG
jgi:hypothetical protein